MRTYYAGHDFRERTGSALFMSGGKPPPERRPMMEPVGFLAAKHGAVALGLLAGRLAKFGRMMATGKQISVRHIVGHLMMMVMVGIVATVAIEVAGITDPGSIAFTAAVFAIAASDVIQWAASRAWRRFLGVEDDL